MLNLDDIHFLENCIPFYTHLNMDEKKQLLQAAYCKVLKKGADLSEQTDDCRGLIIVKEGRIRAYILSDDGREVTLFRMPTKDVCILSASCLFKNLRFTIYLEPEKDSTIYIVPSQAVDELSQYNMKVKEYLLELMSSRFSHAMQVMEQVVFDTLHKRVASFLLEQIQLEGSLNLAITHEVIAKNIGSAREVVSRVLKYFEKEQIIRTSRGKISVDDLEKIKMLAK